MLMSGITMNITKRTSRDHAFGFRGVSRHTHHQRGFGSNVLSFSFTTSLSLLCWGFVDKWLNSHKLGHCWSCHRLERGKNYLLHKCWQGWLRYHMRIPMVDPWSFSVTIVGVPTTPRGGNRKGMCVIGELFKGELTSREVARGVIDGVDGLRHH